MSELAPPPSPAKALLAESEPLEKYHRLLSPWLEQVRDTFQGLTLKDNHGAVVSDPIAVTAGADGDLGAQVSITAPFVPLLVFFRANVLDGNKRPTGAVVGGMALWTGSENAGAQGVTITRAPGLTSGTAYSMTVVALPG